MKSLQPGWLRPGHGSNVVRLVACGGRNEVIEKTPAELKRCLGAGSHTTLMVWADCDDDCASGDDLKALFWEEAARQSIPRAEFDLVVFAFAKDRLENWIEFLQTGATVEDEEGPRVKKSSAVAAAAKALAKHCEKGSPVAGMPPSLRWSCDNWKALVRRMA